MLSRLTSTLASRGDATALLVDETPRSYSELAVSADALAEAMRADRMAGERVALMLPNGIDLVTSYLACFASCAVATPLNARYAPPEVEQALRRARPRWLIANADRLAALQHVDSSVLSGVRIVVAGSDTMAPGDLQAPTSDIAPEADAIIFFTSGSTGRPKGVVHSHGSALAILTSTSEALGGVCADDVVQVFEPLVHVSGFIATFATLLAGGTVALYDGFDVDRYALAAVVGVADAEEGQVPVAFVVARPGASLSADELLAFAAEHIAAYKLPARVHLRPSLPLTASGKISRRYLHE